MFDACEYGYVCLELHCTPELRVDEPTLCYDTRLLDFRVYSFFLSMNEKLLRDVFCASVGLNDCVSSWWQTVSVVQGLTNMAVVPLSCYPSMHR